MALQSSGVITLQDIHDEAGGTTNSTAEATINDTDIRGLINKSSGATMAFDEWYGASGASGSVSFIGASSTTTGNFANGNRTLSSGN